MPPPSLRQLSTAMAIRNVKFLNDIGNIPYSLARPFLLKIESPEKLRSLELLSPQIIADDGELWLEFIKRDIPGWDECDLPEQPDCWYEVYCDLRERVQKAVEEDAEKLKMALDGINSERAKHSAKLVDRRSTPLPRERPTMRQRYASYDRKMGGLPPVFVPRSEQDDSDLLGGPAWSFERPQLPRFETKRKSSIFNVTRRNHVLAIPTKQLSSRASQVKQAPRSLIEEHRRRTEPVVSRRIGPPPPVLIAPGRSRPSTTPFFGGPTSSTASASLREGEARLRALTSGRIPTSQSPVSSSVPARQTSLAHSPAAARTSLQSSPASTSTQNLFESLSAGDRLGAKEAATSEKPGSALRDANSDPGDSRLPTAQPPRVIIRKRPAPSVFIQPKKKRVN